MHNIIGEITHNLPLLFCSSHSVWNANGAQMLLR